jgi:hypothetical protein
MSILEQAGFTVSISDYNIYTQLERLESQFSWCPLLSQPDFEAVDPKNPLFTSFL